MSTITAGDYTVTIDINRDYYMGWLRSSYDSLKEDDKFLSPAIALKAEIIEKITPLIKAKQAELHEEEQQQERIAASGDSEQ